MALFQNDSARERVRGITAEVFGLHFVVDETAMQQFRARMSPRAPAEEQGLDERGRSFQAGALEITWLSDGMRAFTGS